MGKKLAVLLILLLMGSTVWAALDPAIEDLLGKIKSNQSQIKDMSADILTIMKSGGKQMEQKGKIWIKGDNKSRMESSTPVNTVTVVNGDKRLLINQDTGERLVQDMKKLREKTGEMDFGNSPTDQTKALEYFNLKLRQEGQNYIIEGTPKKPNIMLGKVIFEIEEARHLPVKISIYNPKGALVSSSTIEYQKIKNIWVIKENKAMVKTPQGSMNLTMSFNNVKINEGISDNQFKVD